MKKIKNENIKKEENSMIRNIAIFFVVLIIAFFLKVGEKQIKKIEDAKMTDFETQIGNSQDNEDKRAYLYINQEPYEVATNESTSQSYYIVTDGNHIYVAYMNKEYYENIKNNDNIANSIKIDGVTAKMPDDVKQIILEIYNEGLEEDAKITTDDEFYSYFGNIYLDSTTDETTNAFLIKCLFLVFLIIGGIGIIFAIRRYVSFTKAIEKMDNIALSELEEQMNKPDAFYYEKAHLYLTEKYLINFNGKFVVIKYDDIIWMYTYEQRQRGIKTSKSIRITTKNGKSYLIATVTLITKSQKEVFEEVWNTIMTKNKNVLLGNTKENAKEAKERIKENRNN